MSKKKRELERIRKQLARELKGAIMATAGRLLKGLPDDIEAVGCDEYARKSLRAALESCAEWSVTKDAFREGPEHNNFCLSAIELAQKAIWSGKVACPELNGLAFQVGLATDKELLKKQMKKGR
jgi:hypothetical protein